METSQKLGEEGEVDRSLQAAQDAEKTKREKEILEQRLKFPSGRNMFVCEICGVFINSTDNEARRADHYNGKQYLGWKAIRDKRKQLEEKFSRSQEVQILKKNSCETKDRHRETYGRCRSYKSQFDRHQR